MHGVRVFRSDARCATDAPPARALLCSFVMRFRFRSLATLLGLSACALVAACGDAPTPASPGLDDAAGDVPDASNDASVDGLAPNADGGAPGNVDGATDAASHDGGIATDAARPSAGNFPARFAAPYVETWNDNDLSAIASATGHKFYTLAFVINGQGTCNPTWNGDTALGGNAYGAHITALRNAGGDVIVSFGGASGTEMGQACTTVATLQAAYQKVITQFHLTWIDLDIESGAESDTASIDRRNKALHDLQMVNPDLRVSYTLAVDRTGLPAAQINLLKNAQTNGARVDVVNVMAMDYGPCYADMGQAAIDAATATKNQLAGIHLAASVGVTPMAGPNDVTCENFTAANAQQLATFAQSSPFVRLLAFWALGADPNRAFVNAFHPFH